MKLFIGLAGLLFAISGFAAEPEKWALMQRAVLVEHNLDEIRTLVAAGVDPNAPIGCGTYAPLDGSIAQNNLEMMALLLSLGAKPTAAQMVAAVSANTPVALPMVKLLLGAGASVNARNYYSKAENRFTNPIHRAVAKGDRELIAFLVRQPGIELNNPDVNDDTPLMLAITKGDGQIVDMLLASGADPRQKNRAGLDASAVAAGVIRKQQTFLEKLAPVENPTREHLLSARPGA